MPESIRTAESKRSSESRKRPEREASAGAFVTRQPVPVVFDSRERLLSLQQSAGNQFVSRILSAKGRRAVHGRQSMQASASMQRQEVAAPQTDEEARAAFELGRTAYDNAQYDEALRHFEAAINAPGLEPEHMPELIWNTAITRARLGDEDGAMTEAVTYGQYRLDEDQLIQLVNRILYGEPEEAGGDAAGMPQTDEEARAAFELGRTAYDSGQYDEALRQFEAAINAPGLEPEHMPELIWNTAITRARLGDEDGAMTDAVTYGQYRPDEDQLIQLVNRILHGEPAEAGGGAAAMPQTDEEARAAFELGRTAYDSGDYAEALRQFEAAVNAPGLAPEHMPELIWNTAITRARLGDEDGAMTDAVTYGQYRPDEQQLVQLIQGIINGSSEEEAGGAEPSAE